MEEGGGSGEGARLSAERNAHGVVLLACGSPLAPPPLTPANSTSGASLKGVPAVLVTFVSPDAVPK